MTTGSIGPATGPEAVHQLVTDYCTSAGLEWEPGARHREVVVTLPGEHKLRTVCALIVSDRALSAQAFVVRNPDENHEAVYRHLLRRNLRLPGLAYAIDSSGDVYVTGRLPLAGVDEQVLDELLGAVLAASDEPFDEVLRLGFLTSMRREWAWRTSRGESTANLARFRHLLADPEGGGPQAPGQRPEDGGAPAH